MLQKMKLNLKKCKEMLLDFRKCGTCIPSLKFNDTTLERVPSFKLLGLWIDNNLKWQTNTDYIIRKAVKRLFLLKVLKKCGASRDDMKRFFTPATRPILEYGAQVWHGGLTKAQSSSIDPQHKLHHLLPNRLCQIQERDTRQNGQLFYNYQCRTEWFRNSPIVSPIELYNNPIL